MLFQVARIVLVIVLLTLAAAIATPKGRLPLALRGIKRMLNKDNGATMPLTSAPERVTIGKRLIAFALILITIAVVMI